MLEQIDGPFLLPTPLLLPTVLLATVLLPAMVLPPTLLLPLVLLHTLLSNCLPFLLSSTSKGLGRRVFKMNQFGIDFGDKCRV